MKIQTSWIRGKLNDEKLIKLKKVDSSWVIKIANINQQIVKYFVWRQVKKYFKLIRKLQK